MELDRPIYTPEAYLLPKTVVDLGCCQGVTTKAYADLWPEAKIIGVELMYDNYLVARALLEPYGDRISLINAGVWSHNGDVECAIWETETSHIRATRQEQQGRAIAVLPCLTLDTITNHLESIDFIKFDIEAAEHEVLRRGGNWVEKTKSMFIEIHDVSNTTVRNLVKDLGFDVYHEEFEKIWAERTNS